MDDPIMTIPNSRFGIPNLELGCSSGATINPASFAGHELIALFCPLEASAAAQEIAAYRRHSAKFVEHDTWLLTFAEHCNDSSIGGPGRVLTIPDPERRAWIAFRDLVAHPEEMDRSSGAAFLFSRGGGLHRYWRGAGHVDEVLAELPMLSSDATGS